MTGPDAPDSDAPDFTAIGAMSEDELMLCLGQENVGEVAVPESLGTLIEKGREILNDLKPKLRSVLCVSIGMEMGVLPHFPC